MLSWSYQVLLCMLEMCFFWTIINSIMNDNASHLSLGHIIFSTVVPGTVFSYEINTQFMCCFTVSGWLHIENSVDRCNNCGRRNRIKISGWRFWKLIFRQADKHFFSMCEKRPKLTKGETHMMMGRIWKFHTVVSRVVIKPGTLELWDTSDDQ